MAMHKSKERGGNQCQFYSAVMSESTIAKIAVVAAMRNAIRLDQQALHYQPFVDMQTGRIGGIDLALWPKLAGLLTGASGSVANDRVLRSFPAPFQVSARFLRSCAGPRLPIEIDHDQAHAFPVACRI